MTKLLTTSEFAAALGVSESSVRRLADSGDLQIHRTRGGHRRIPVPEAVRYVRDTKAHVLRPDLIGLHPERPDVQEGGVDQRMLSVLREGHASAVVSLMRSLYAGGMSIAGLCDGPISHAMRVIGEAWPHDQRAIFIEHRAVILCIRALNQLRLSVPEPDLDAPTAIGGAMSGDRYLLPTLMASLVIHELGFNETNLGADLPLDVLTDCVEDEKPALVWLAISEPIRSRTQMSELFKLAEAASHNNTRLIIGGRHASKVKEAIAVPSKGDVKYCATMKCLESSAAELMGDSGTKLEN